MATFSTNLRDFASLPKVDSTLPMRWRYRLTIGSPIDPETLPSGSAEATEFLKARTLGLVHPGTP